MKNHLLFFFILLSAQGFSQDQKKNVLNVVNSFFDLVEKQDTMSLKALFLKDAYDYYVKEEKDTVRAGGRPSTKFNFSAERILSEKLRAGEEIVMIHKRLAMVWAPYDFWINGRSHHCGVDAFTLIRTKDQWKIASIAFTIETENCREK
jgi:hypothetical protein